MKFGLMTQLQIPRPWEPNAELNAYRHMIEQAVAGEAAGFHYFWLTEMHFFKQIGHSPCPDLLHAALSQRYAGSRHVAVMPLENEAAKRGRLEPEALNDTNKLELYVFGSDKYRQAVLVARLDNLGKGASGAAVQNMRLMLGLSDA